LHAPEAAPILAAMRHLLLVLACALLAPTAFAAATFTRVTDPANPLVNDALESGGMSWVDLNGDGRLDVFVAHGNLANQDNALLLNQGGMSFLPVTTGALVHDGGSSIGGAWGDWDNDGFPDLFVTNRNNWGNFLYHGLGDTLFDKVTTGPVVTDIANSNSASWIDADNDGDLDLYVINFQGDDYLYVNGGPPSFPLTRDATRTITVGTEFSIAGNWADYNEDNRPDLFIGNAGNQNDALWTNQGGLTWTRTTLADGRQTLGGSWGDYDDDGHLDFFAANLLNQASILWHNAGPPTYALSPVAAGAMTTELASSVGSAWGDVDNDGDLDLYVARDGQVAALYLNDGPPAYTFTRKNSGVEVTTVSNGFGCGMVDVDNDGRLDLFVANRTNQSDLLYHNEGDVNHWLALHLVGTASNRSAIGARVRVKATIAGIPRWMTQEVQAQSGYNCQVVDLHFGLGDATVADSVVVRWPSGAVDELPGVQGDDRRVIVEGVGVVGVPAPAANALSLRVGPGGRVVFALPRAGRATVRLYDVRGRLVSTLADGTFEAGEHTLRATAPMPARGLYFCRLEALGQAASHKYIVLR
jgi:hypothetical protein